MLQDLLQEIVNNPIASLSIIGNLILIESLLSIDNAAVLATMVMDLPEHQRSKALKYGIWGAYFFRGLALVFAAALIKIWWLSPLGGLYLVYLALSWYRSKSRKKETPIEADKKKNWFYHATVGRIGNFWATVATVELMDLAFSLDNVFAAVAFTPNILLICLGVFIGILAMRFVAVKFVVIMEKFPFLEAAAYLVIFLLGVKLTLSVYEHFYPESPLTVFLKSHTADVATSILTIAIFVLPVVTSYLFNVPKRHID